MKTMKMMTVMVAMMVAVGALAANTDTPEGLAEEFIGAVNAKSADRQRELVHPLYLATVSGLQKDFMDETLSRDFRRVIPEQRTVKVTPIEGPDLPFAGAMDWLVKPTHQIEIQFSKGENSSATYTRFVAKEKDKWYLVIPMLTPENLKKYEEQKTSQPGAAPLPSAPQTAPSESAR